VQRPIKLV